MFSRSSLKSNTPDLVEAVDVAGAPVAHVDMTALFVGREVGVLRIQETPARDHPLRARNGGLARYRPYSPSVYGSVPSSGQLRYRTRGERAGPSVGMSSKE